LIVNRQKDKLFDCIEATLKQSNKPVDLMVKSKISVKNVRWITTRVC